MGCRTRLPKFKFLANFPIGLYVILQTQIFKKNEKCLISYGKKYFNQKTVEVQPWTPLEVILNEFCLWITIRCMQRSRKWVLPHWIRLYLPPLNHYPSSLYSLVIQRFWHIFSDTSCSSTINKLWNMPLINEVYSTFFFFFLDLFQVASLT